MVTPHRLGRRTARLAFAALSSLLALSLFLVALTVVVPHVPFVALALHPLVQALTLDLALASILCIGAGVALRRGGSPRLGGAVVAASTASAVTFAVVLVDLHRAAREAGITASLGEQLAPRRDDTRFAATTEVYSEVDGRSLALDAWLVPKRATVDARRGENANRAPGVVWLHGGGFTRGARAATPKWNEWLNEHGYAAFDVDYRLAPPASWDDAPRDVLCALGWIATHADRLGVDPRRLAVVGQSAGGTLALLAGYRDLATPPRRECEAAALPVAAVVALYPVIDVREFWERNTVFGSSRRWSEQFAGGTPNEFPERYEAVSPRSHVHRGVPPTLVVQGVDDNVVPFGNAIAFDAALRDVGATHRLVGIDHTDHGFDRFWGSVPTQIARHDIERFLDEHIDRQKNARRPR